MKQADLAKPLALRVQFAPLHHSSTLFQVLWIADATADCTSEIPVRRSCKSSLAIKRHFAVSSGLLLPVLAYLLRCWFGSRIMSRHSSDSPWDAKRDPNLSRVLFT